MDAPTSEAARYPRTLTACHNVMDFRERARRRLPRPVFDFLDGGAETESTARRNTAAFDEAQLVPRSLVDVQSLSTATRVLGQELAWPLLCSPTGLSRLFHPQGELAVARAAAKTNTLYGVATGSSYTLEAIAAAGSGAKFFLLYPYRDRELVNELIDRAKAAGYGALCVMVDVPAMGKRERDLRSGFADWPKWPLRSLSSLATRPRWVLGQLREGPIGLANLASRGPQGPVAQQIDASFTWKSIAALASRWGGPIALKGILSVDDAKRAADAGVSAVVVSNHGGRQLDGAPSPIEVLPEIARAVGDRIEVILDGGIRRGVHIVKALALGAKACSIGRPYLYGLAAGGEAGVVRILSILREEFELALKLCGCADVRNLDRGMIWRRP